MEVSAYRRFMLGLLGSTVVIAGAGMLVYLREPALPIQPSLIHKSNTAFAKSSVTAKPEDERSVHALLEQFVAGFERQDVKHMRLAFPELTQREARVLRSIRQRLGEDAVVTIAKHQVIAVTPDVIDLDFVLSARVPGRATERRMPFHATVRSRGGVWKIEELR